MWANCATLSGCAYRIVFADSSNHWIVDFAHPGIYPDWPEDQRLFDIRPGYGNEARQPDEDEDSTTVQWYVPNPYIQGSPNSWWVQGR